LNITTEELIQRIEFGLKRLREEQLSARQQADILRAIGGISRKRYEQLDEQLKEEVAHG
jgi:hypothetical protein